MLHTINFSLTIDFAVLCIAVVCVSTNISYSCSLTYQTYYLAKPFHCSVNVKCYFKIKEKQKETRKESRWGEESDVLMLLEFYLQITMNLSNLIIIKIENEI